MNSTTDQLVCDSTENPPLFCDFLCSIYDRITEIYNDIVDHENLTQKCTSCQEDNREIPFIKNHIFAMMQGDLELKKEDDADEDDAFMEIAENFSHPTSPASTRKVSYHGKTDFKEDIEDIMKDSIWDPDDDGPTEDYTLLAERYLKDPEYNVRDKVYIDMWLKPKNTKRKIAPIEAYEAPAKYPCSYCPEKFNSFLKIKAHCRTMHPDKPKMAIPRFQCDICGAFAQRPRALEQHKLYHTDIYAFECALCEKKFRNKQKLQEHIQTHLPKDQRDRKYKCKDCDKCYSSWSTLYSHKKAKHEEDTRPEFKCQVCPKIYRTELSLQKHLMTHAHLTGDLGGNKRKKVHPCDLCDEKFTSTQKAKDHRRIHVQEYGNYSCALCEKRFTQKCNLACHIRFLHSGNNGKKNKEENLEEIYIPNWKKLGKNKCKLCKGIYMKNHVCKKLQGPGRIIFQEVHQK